MSVQSRALFNRESIIALRGWSFQSNMVKLSAAMRIGLSGRVHISPPQLMPMGIHVLGAFRHWATNPNAKNAMVKAASCPFMAKEQILVLREISRGRKKQMRIGGAFREGVRFA